MSIYDVIRLYLVGTRRKARAATPWSDLFLLRCYGFLRGVMEDSKPRTGSVAEMALRIEQKSSSAGRTSSPRVQAEELSETKGAAYDEGAATFASVNEASEPRKDSRVKQRVSAFEAMRKYSTDIIISIALNCSVSLFRKN